MTNRSKSNAEIIILIIVKKCLKRFVVTHFPNKESFTIYILQKIKTNQISLCCTFQQNCQALLFDWIGTGSTLCSQWSKKCPALQTTKSEQMPSCLAEHQRQHLREEIHYPSGLPALPWLRPGSTRAAQPSLRSTGFGSRSSKLVWVCTTVCGTCARYI